MARNGDSPDSQGHYNNFGPNLPEAGPRLTPEVAAELDAVWQRGVAIEKRFREILPENHYYWQMIVVEKIARYVFRAPDVADGLRDMIIDIRTRTYAQIESEMKA